MTITSARPTLVTATQVSRGFATILERAKYGESFTVTKNGEQIARILPPASIQPNGAAVLAFLRSWEPDPDGFSDDVIAIVESFGDPSDRDRERMSWLDELA